MVYVQQVRDECLSCIKKDLSMKEDDLRAKVKEVKDKMADQESLTSDELASKQFQLSVLESRLQRQESISHKFYVNAETKIRNDPRLVKFLLN